MTFVLDASIAIRWFIEEETHPNADIILSQLINTPFRYAVPELFAYEVYAVLHRIHPAPLSTYTGGIVPLLQSGVLRQPMTASLAEKASRFVKLGLTGYDACYAALAADLNGTWLTFDQKAPRKIIDERVSWFVGTSLPDW